MRVPSLAAGDSEKDQNAEIKIGCPMDLSSAFADPFAEARLKGSEYEKIFIKRINFRDNIHYLLDYCLFNR